MTYGAAREWLLAISGSDYRPEGFIVPVPCVISSSAF